MRLPSLKASISLCLIGASFAVAPTAASAREKVLYSFCQTSGCPDGQDPYSPLVQDSVGNLYGTTLYGGNSSNTGTIYELQKVGRKGWAFRSLYSFCTQANCTDGSTPYGSLIVDTSGNLYGTTLMGGNANNGVVYELETSGTLGVLYSFCAETGCADGAQPYAGLTYQGQQNGQLYDGSSTLYGTTSLGGKYEAINGGVAFSLSPGGQEAVLHNFGSNVDGLKPLSPLIMDGDGNLYGTTEYGGSTSAGTIFELSPSGNETLFFLFCSQEGQACGLHPGTGALLMQADGTLVGTTPVGGRAEGVIFSLAGQTYTTLATLCPTRNCKAGADSQSALIEDTLGNLYGVAPLGGRNGNDKGTVFELSGSTLKAIYSFCTQTNCMDGAEPYSKLTINDRGALFGTTTQGGAFNGGTIFELP